MGTLINNVQISTDLFEKLISHAKKHYSGSKIPDELNCEPNFVAIAIVCPWKIK